MRFAFPPYGLFPALRAKKNAVILSDSRKMDAFKTLPKKFKLCVMSPPYLNSFDYTDVYRPELFLGKFIKTQKDLKSLRYRTLRSHVQIKWSEPTDKSFGNNFLQCYEEIKSQSNILWDKRIPMMIQAYFEDMKKVLNNLKLMARPDASIWIVVSTSAYGGVEISS